jgi:hypothetical protein
VCLEFSPQLGLLPLACCAEHFQAFCFVRKYGCPSQHAKYDLEEREKRTSRSQWHVDMFSYRKKNVETKFNGFYC